ncbi:hypothetical protein N9985_03020 [Gammaproteobacteria bacterium]|nr:hypothetical protein [Gammaproteobacteria bacterium]
MLDQILKSVQLFEVEHGMSPDTVYINPYHYEGLRRYHPDLFGSDDPVTLGFRIIIVPGNVLTHPEAALSGSMSSYSDVA